MKFKVLYLMAKMRGLFLDNQKGTLVFGSSEDKDTVKQMYYHGGYVPYRIDNLVTYR